ncbi:MAG TPA: redoxin domain-containing protein [Gaiellaceae bacterium]|jgi:cytochrome c biogenesis protein CcmG/thiol:disulfide interchange protein DsbE|nr:redoxin domain-containing protein [Gaiellaceae bacterium]
MARRGKLILQAAAVTVVALLVVLLGWRVAQQEEGRGLDDAVAAGKRPAAPDFALESLDGEETISLSDYRGKAVVLNFWASWCQPCKQEAPLLQGAWERYRGDGLVVLGVDAQDLKSDARRFVERYGLTYPIAHDRNGVTLGRYGYSAFPETWFVDREGRLVGEHIRGEFTEEQLEENIRLALHG